MALDLAQHFFAALPELRIHPTAKRIRAFVGDDTVIDSTSALIVWEPRRIVPSYAVPLEDISAPLQPAAADATAEELAVEVSGAPVLDPRTGFALHTVDGQSFDIAAATRLPNAAFVADDPDLEGYAIIDFDAFDEWREEDELLVAHARDPFGTVDTRRSSRRVVIEIAGTTIADSTRSVMLFETFLPTRVLPAPRGRADGPARAHGHADRLRLQGLRLVLVGERRRHRRGRRGVELRGPAQLRRGGERDDLLLQRACRREHRRRAGSSAREPRGRRTERRRTLWLL